MEDTKAQLWKTAQGMDIREATNKARMRSTWRLLVRVSSSRTSDGAENL